jgi:hypothetical protein
MKKKKNEEIVEVPLDLENIVSVTMSLLLKKRDPNSKHKGEYEKKVTAKFVVPEDFPRTDDYFEGLIDDMFKDLLVNKLDDFDSVGLWIEYETVVENAMTVEMLNAIKELSHGPCNPLWEFFKMTVRRMDI